MIDRETWNGRAVTFAEFSIREGRAVTEAFQRDAEDGAMMLLVQALRYADDGSAVFGSLDEVLGQPFRLRERLSYLAGKCAFVNGLRGQDPDADVTPANVAAGQFDSNAPAQANGHDPSP